MKEQVTYSCGHSGTVEVFGKGADREKKLQWYSRSATCPECYKAAEAAKLAKASAGLPELQGSPKQVEWAYKLRGQLITNLQETIAGKYTAATRERLASAGAREFLATSGSSSINTPGELVWLTNRLRRAQAETSTKWFIDSQESAYVHLPYRTEMVAKYLEVGETALIALAREQGEAQGATEEQLAKSAANISQMGKAIAALVGDDVDAN